MQIRQSFIAVAVAAAVAVPSHPAMTESSPTALGPDPTNTRNLMYAARTEAAAHMQYDGYAEALPADRAPTAGVWRAVVRA